MVLCRSGRPVLPVFSFSFPERNYHAVTSKGRPGWHGTILLFRLSLKTDLLTRIKHEAKQVVPTTLLLVDYLSCMLRHRAGWKRPLGGRSASSGENVNK